MVRLGSHAFVVSSGIYIPERNGVKPVTDESTKLWELFGSQIMNQANRKIGPQFMVKYGLFISDDMYVQRKTAVFGQGLRKYLLGSLNHGGIITDKILNSEQQINSADVDGFLGLEYKDRPLTTLTIEEERGLKFTSLVDNYGNTLHIAEYSNPKLRLERKRQFHIFERKELNTDIPAGLNRLTRVMSSLTKAYPFRLRNISSPVIPFVPNPDWQDTKNVYYARITVKVRT